MAISKSDILASLDMMGIISKNIRRALLRKGWTWKTLSEKSLVEPIYMQGATDGCYCLSFIEMITIADLLGVSLDWLRISHDDFKVTTPESPRIHGLYTMKQAAAQLGITGQYVRLLVGRLKLGQILGLVRMLSTDDVECIRQQLGKRRPAKKILKTPRCD